MTSCGQLRMVSTVVSVGVMVRNRYMLLEVAKIGIVRLQRYAFAKILRLHVTKIDAPAR